MQCDDFVFDLIGRAEDVRVVLRKAAHAQQAVHHAAAFVAIHRAHLAKAHRQVTIDCAACPCRSGCGRGNSWA